MFDRKIAITATQLTAPPAIMLTPITIDSGDAVKQRPDCDGEPGVRAGRAGVGVLPGALAVMGAAPRDVDVRGCVDRGPAQKAEQMSS